LLYVREMDDFVVIGEREGKAFVETVTVTVKMKEPLIVRYDLPLTLPPVQEIMERAPSLADVVLPPEWKRAVPQVYWLNRFNSRCGCLLHDGCVEPHQCQQKIWLENPHCRLPKYRGPHQHIL
jgi:hypothetical protein